MTDPDDSEFDRALDDAFEAAGDAADRDGPPSVLARIGELTGEAPGVSLRDLDPSGNTPLLKPLGPGEDKLHGKYMVQGMLGQGGVGAVHKGHDTDLGRDVAMKFLHDRYAEAPDVLHRFVEEAQIGGQLQHPGIVPVYDLGMREGKPFFTMKLVKGETLAKQLADREEVADNRRRLLSVFEDVCQTMAYAHARGVVHRDLKPANIMVGAFGEVQVVDWGMGKVLQSGGVADEMRAANAPSRPSVIETVRSSGHGTQSVMGSVMGTPAYMPPEQARGDVEAMDERSDVFALGAILCEILTGQPPYVGDHDELIAMAAMAQLEGATSRLATCGAEPDLVELTTQCLMPAPAARPKSAEAVASAIHDHLAAVEARVHDARVEAAEAKVKADALKRTQKLGIALTTAIAAGLLVSVWFWFEADDQRALAVAAADKERAAADLAESRRLEADKQRALAEEQRQLVARRADELQQVAEFQSQQLREVRPSVMGVQIRDAVIAAVSAEQRESLDATLAAVNFTDIGLGALRESVFLPALSTIDLTFGDQPIVAAQLLGAVGGTMVELDLVDEAKGALQRVVETYRDQYGNDDPRTLDAVEALADVREVTDGNAAARALRGEVVRSRIRALGEKDPSTLLSKARLARMTRNADVSAPALRALRQQLVQALGEDHENTIEVTQYLAQALRGQGRHAEAAEMYRLCVGSGQQSVRDPVDFAVALTELSDCVKHTGDVRAALQLSIDAASSFRRVYGSMHHKTIEALNTVSAHYSDLGDLDAAARVNREALDASRGLGESHFVYYHALQSLAHIRELQGRDEEAEAALRKLVAVTKGLPDDDPTRLLPLQFLGQHLTTMGKYRESVDLLRECLDGLQRAQLEERDIAVTRAYLGAALLRAKDVPAGAAELERAVQDLRAMGGTLDLYRALESLHDARIYQNRREESLALMREAYRGYAAAFGDDSNQAVVARVKIGDGLALLSSVEAESYLRAVRPVANRVLGEDHWAVAQADYSLGFCLLHGPERMANLAESESLMRKGIDGPRRGLARDDLLDGSRFFQLGGCLLLQGKWAEAADAFEKSTECFGRLEDSAEIRHLLKLSRRLLAESQERQRQASRERADGTSRGRPEQGSPAWKVARVFRMLSPRMPESERDDPRALELAQSAVEATQRKDISALQALGEALFANGKQADAAEAMGEAMVLWESAEASARQACGERDLGWMKKRVEAYR